MNKAIINCQTGEEIIEPMTEVEIAQAKELAKEAAEAEQNLAAAKAALLQKLGITEEEAKLLLS